VLLAAGLSWALGSVFVLFGIESILRETECEYSRRSQCGRKYCLWKKKKRASPRIMTQWQSATGGAQEGEDITDVLACVRSTASNDDFSRHRFLSPSLRLPLSPFLFLLSLLPVDPVQPRASYPSDHSPFTDYLKSPPLSFHPLSPPLV